MSLADSYTSMSQLPHVPDRIDDSLDGIILAVADTFASVTFSLAIGTTMEALSGLSAWEIVKSRTAMTGVNIATGRPYGWFRDKVQSLVGGEKGGFRRIAGDALAMSIGYLPIYAAMIGAITRSWEKVKTASSTMACTIWVTGPPYGWYLDKVRSWFGVGDAKESDVQSREEYRENLSQWLGTDTPTGLDDNI